MRNEAMEVALLNNVSIDLLLSIRQLVTVSGINCTSIRKILKSHKLHPYKINLAQELNEDDFQRSLEFWQHWSDENQHLFREVHIQHPEKLNA